MTDEEEFSKDFLQDFKNMAACAERICKTLYIDYLKDNHIIISMTENGDPYENAVAERINGILKDEFSLSEQLNNLGEAIRQTAQSISIYNNRRPHLSCHMLTPVQMHQQKKSK